MVKLTFDKAGFDPNGLHEELGDLGENYYLTHTEAEIIIMFPEINEQIIVEVVDEVENTITEYYKEKEVETDGGFDEEGNHIVIKTINRVPFDFTTLEAAIENTKASHDPLKRQKKLDNENILKHIKETDSELVRGLEDLYEWAEGAGFVPVQAQKDRITERKNLRSQLQEV